MLALAQLQLTMPKFTTTIPFETIFWNIRYSMENDFARYFDFRMMAERATEKEKLLKFPRYTKNLRYNSEGIYSYKNKIANLNLMNRTVQKIGYWSPTTSKHYNYAKHILNLSYGITEVEPVPLLHIQELSYWDHT
jgi:hypothetical protein